MIIDAKAIRELDVPAAEKELSLGGERKAGVPDRLRKRFAPP